MRDERLDEETERLIGDFYHAHRVSPNYATWLIAADAAASALRSRIRELVEEGQKEIIERGCIHDALSFGREL